MPRNRDGDGARNPDQQDMGDLQVDQTDQNDPSPDAGQDSNAEQSQDSANNQQSIETPDAPPQDEPPKAENPPPASGEKVRVKCAALAGKAVIIGAETIQTDNEGVFEVDGAQATRLLTIPSYEKV